MFDYTSIDVYNCLCFRGYRSNIDPYPIPVLKLSDLSVSSFTLHTLTRHFCRVEKDNKVE